MPRQVINDYYVVKLRKKRHQMMWACYEPNVDDDHQSRSVHRQVKLRFNKGRIY